MFDEKGESLSFLKAPPKVHSPTSIVGGSLKYSHDFIVGPLNFVNIYVPNSPLSPLRY